MTTFKDRSTDAAEATATAETTATKASEERKLTLAEILELVAGSRLPLRFTAYDGSSAGPPDAPFRLDLTSPRGTTYLATGRGDLGLARAYIAGDLEIHGVHPGDPYELLRALADELVFRMPPPRAMARIVRSIGPVQDFAFATLAKDVASTTLVPPPLGEGDPVGVEGVIPGVS